jgi:MFS family permease
MAQPGTPAALSDRRWVILSVVAVAQLMVVLDATIVNIALPSAQRALGFPDSDRQWVVTAYALAFGSLLLVGGRLAHQHQSRHESVRAHVRSGTTRAYPRVTTPTS